MKNAVKAQINTALLIFVAAISTSQAMAKPFSRSPDSIFIIDVFIIEKSAPASPQGGQLPCVLTKTCE